MSDHAYDASIADFDQTVIAASHEVPVLVDFWAEWCGPCRVLKPVLEKLAAEFGGRFRLAKVNSDDNPELAQRYGVRGIPSVKAFRGGKLVDEFTGALPEGQIRVFLERLLPSLAEPLRLAAAEARAAGDLATARRTLLEALDIDPRHEATLLDLAEVNLAAGGLDEARQILEAVEHKARDTTRLHALQAQLNLAGAADGGGADIALLEQRIAADPADLDSRRHLAQALALKGDYRPAFEHLLEIVRRDRKWNDEAARRTLLDLFKLLGANAEHDDLVREYRVRLSRLLN